MREHTNTLQVTIPVSIPLTAIEFGAQIVGLFAQVKATQHFSNQNEKPIEAVYVFPLPEGASVNACSMKIGSKVVTAELQEQEIAREIYDNAVKSGHHAALVEQKRPNIFKMNVGGIEPGEQISVELTYTERVQWQNNGGRFRIPLVVAPRFIPGTSTGKTGGGWSPDTDAVPDASEITPPLAPEGVLYQASITVAVQPGFACSIASPSHSQEIGTGDISAEVEKSFALSITPNRDFILVYKAVSEVVGTALHYASFKDEQYLCASIIPPGTQEELPKDIVMLLDISGSMRGEKLAGLKAVAGKVLTQLAAQNADNRVAVVAFESRYELTSPLAPFDEQVLTAVSQLEVRGGTMAGKAIDYAFSLLTEQTRDRYILLITDGQSEDRWKQVVPGIRVIAVGIDAAVNLDHHQKIARETGGTAYAIYPGEDYTVAARTLTGLLSGPVLRDIDVLVDDELASTTVGLRNAYQGMPASLFLITKNLPGKLVLSATNPAGERVTIPVQVDDAGACSFVHQLWAREKLRDGALAVETQVALSLDFGVLCQHTAFVAVHYKDIPGSTPERIWVPVELPHTWQWAEPAFAHSLGISSVSADAFLSSPMMGGESVRCRGAVRARTVKRLSGGSLESFKQANYQALSHPVDLLEELIADFEQGIMDRQDIMDVLINEFSVVNLESWNELQKCKTFYLLRKLGVLGFTVPTELLDVVTVEPIDPEAHAWWQKAQDLATP